MRRQPAIAMTTLVVLLAAGCGGTGPAARPGADASSASSTSGASSAPSAPATDPASDQDGTLVPTNLPDVIPDLTRTPKPTGTVVRPRAEKVYGADVSWPQCPKGMGIPQKRSHGAPMPTAAARFVILGLTNGPSFVANPCLADQVRWVADRHLLGAAYAVVSYPDAGTLVRYRDQGPFPASTTLGALRNVGYRAALFNVASMRAAGLRSPIVWVDVEPVPDFEWSSDPAANAAVVQGTVRGYTDAGFRTGFYSTPSLWTRVVGGLRVGSPEWRAAGQTSEAEALSRCGDDWSFQGGPGVFGQWVEDGRDRNVTCPGIGAGTGTGVGGGLDGFFHQY